MRHSGYLPIYLRLYHTAAFLWLVLEPRDGQSRQVRCAVFLWKYHLYSRVEVRVFRTGFLIGFKRQFQSMVDEKRRTTSIVFGSALLGTLVSAILFDSRLLVFVCLIVQIPAYIWYCASYFPFAQDCIKACLRGLTERFRK